VRKTIISALIGAGVMFAPPAADAVGLGKMTVLSSLGQPFRGEIELHAVDKLEEGALSAALASQDAFKTAKIDRPTTLATLRFGVEQKKSGEWFIKLTSPQPINDPFLDMLIEVNWPAGRLLREYTVLLDPPGVAAEQATPLEALAGKEMPVELPKVQVATPKALAAPVEAPKAQAPVAPPRTQALPAETAKAPPPAETPKAQALPAEAPKAVEPVLRTEKTLATKPAAAPIAKAEAPPAAENKPAAESKPATETPKVESKPAAEKPKAESKPKAATYGPVKPGQTLRKIAAAVKPESVSLEQMLVSLYRANQQAFDGNNMNRLKTGQILRIPENGKVVAQDHNEAQKEVRAHAADWHSYQQKLAGAVEAAKPVHEDQARQAAGGKITAATEDKALGAKEPAKDVLKLSRSEQSGGKPGKTAASEDAIARDKALQEANLRIAELEKSIKNMQQLLEIRSQGATESKEAAKPAPAPTPAPAPAPAPVPPPAAEPPKPKHKVVTLAAKPVEASPSFLGALLGNPFALGGGALAVLLGGLFGARAIRRKIEERKADKDTVGKAAQPGNAPADFPPEASSALTDFTQSGLGGIDTNEVDPIAEAEVYMAYGRDVQAEEILREAMARDPQRHEIQLKLLEIYAGRKDRGSFEALARQFYAATGGAPNPDWNKAAEMGRALDAGNPLYAEAEAPAAEEPPQSESIDLDAAQVAVDTSPDLDFNLGAVSEPPGEMDIALDSAQAGMPVEDMAPSLDFDLGLEAATPQAEEKAPPPPENLLDFNLETPPEPAVEAIEEAPPAAPAPTVEEDEHILNFDLEFPTEILDAEAKKTEETPGTPVRKEGLISAESWQAAVADLEPDFSASAIEPETPAMPTLDIPGLDIPGLEMPEPEMEKPAEKAEASGASLDETMMFDLSALTAEEPIAPATPAAATPAPAPAPVEQEAESILISPPAMSDEAMLDFDFDIGEETPPPTAASNIDLSGIDLNLSPDASAGETGTKQKQEDAARFQDAATKMDLAKAYIEMGDKEGASEILQEVLKEGSEEQQADAKKLLAGIR